MYSVIFSSGGLFCFFYGFTTISNADYVTHQTVGILLILIGVIAFGFAVLFWKLDNIFWKFSDMSSNNNDRCYQNKNISDKSGLDKENEQNTEDNKTE